MATGSWGGGKGKGCCFHTLPPSSLSAPTPLSRLIKYANEAWEQTGPSVSTPRYGESGGGGPGGSHSKPQSKIKALCFHWDGATNQRNQYIRTGNELQIKSLGLFSLFHLSLHISSLSLLPRVFSSRSFLIPLFLSLKNSFSDIKFLLLCHMLLFWKCNQPSTFASISLLLILLLFLFLSLFYQSVAKSKSGRAFIF